MPKRKSSARGRGHYQKKGSLRRLNLFLAKKIRLLIVSLGLVLGVFVLFGLIYLFQYFRTNLTQASSGVFLSASSLDVSHDFNLLVFKIEDLSNPTSPITGLAVLNFQVQKNKLFILPLSPDESLTNPFRPGRLILSSLYGLSRLSQGKNDAKFSLEKTLSLQLGLPLDGVFYTDETGYTEMELDGQFLTNGHDFLSNARYSTKIMTQLGSSLKTNLDLKSILLLSRFLVLNFPQNMEVLNVKQIADNLEKDDSLFRDKLVNQQILEERQSAIVLNGTQINGLATNLGRIVSNLGLSLLSSGNAPWAESNSQSFMITKSSNSYTALRLAKILGIDDVRSAEAVSNDPNFSRLLRADIILVAGLDQVK